VKQAVSGLKSRDEEKLAARETYTSHRKANDYRSLSPANVLGKD